MESSTEVVIPAIVGDDVTSGLDIPREVTTELAGFFSISNSTDGNFSQRNATQLTVHPGVRVYELYLYIAIGIVGVFGNGFVILVFYTSQKLRAKPCIMLIINQSLIDFTSAAFLVLTANVHSGVYEGLQGVWDEIYCRLWASKVFLWTSLYTSTNNLVAITLERYVAIMHPLTYSVSFNTHRAFIACVVVWVSGLTFKPPSVIPTTAVVDGVCVYMGIWPSPFWKRFAGVLSAFINYFIPIALMGICYGRMAMTLRSSSQGSTDKNRENKMKRASSNVVKTFGLVTLTFILCWTSNVIYFFLFNLGILKYNKGFGSVTVSLAFLNCCCNPFIYAFKYQEFQNESKRLLCKAPSSESWSESSAATKGGTTTSGTP